MTVKMPKVGDSADEVTIIEWTKAVGQAVAAGDTLLSVETAKVTVDVPSPVAGVVVELLAAADSDVKVGAPIAVLDDA